MSARMRTSISQVGCVISLGAGFLARVTKTHNRAQTMSKSRLWVKTFPPFLTFLGAFITGNICSVTAAAAAVAEIVNPFMIPQGKHSEDH